MVNMKSALRVAALSAMVLGFASAGFVASASAEDGGKNGQEQKPVTDVHGEGNNSSLRSNGVNDVNAGDGGNNSSLRSNNVKDVAAGNGGNAANLRASGIGSGGNPTGEGAMLTGNCFADMPVYNKEGKFIGRGIVNTCN